MSAPATPAKGGKLRQVAQAYRITKKSDPRLGWVLLAWFLGVGLVIGFPGWVFFHPVFGVVIGALMGLLAMLVVFGRRAERAAYAQSRGQRVPAAGPWRFRRQGGRGNPPIPFPRNRDAVHPVAGRDDRVEGKEGGPRGPPHH